MNYYWLVVAFLLGIIVACEWELYDVEQHIVSASVH
jgi:hypothetical protein